MKWSPENAPLRLAIDKVWRLHAVLSRGATVHGPDTPVSVPWSYCFSECRLLASQGATASQEPGFGS